MRISFGAPKIPTRGIIVLFVSKGGKLSQVGQNIDQTCKGALKRSLKVANFEAKLGDKITVFAPSGYTNATFILVGVGESKQYNELRAQKVGAAIIEALQSSKELTAVIMSEIQNSSLVDNTLLAANIAFGARLRSYAYEKYKTKKESSDQKSSIKKLTFMLDRPNIARKKFEGLSKIADGVDFARDLVSEPSNIKTPKWMAQQCRKLSRLGVKVEVLGETQMKKLQMNALLGVGQGSVNESQCVIMSWNGNKESKKTLGLIGKGVTFDTGGISLKPANGMEEMIWDMGGAGSVIGTMCSIAGRNAKANVVGVVGLVENMPDGNAQRPGDIVKSMSGQTIEVINTDAEGRLVLADLLWYAQKRFKPAAMIDLATLTGAIMVALGREYAGLYTSNEAFGQKIIAAGKCVNEKLWHMPLDPEYDKQINSPRADMKNIGPRWGGSITAAQFLQRFTNGIDWAHLDIAGVAWSDKNKDTMEKGATAFGVRTLDRLIQDHYELK